ncbi:hypothetical protein KIL84_019863 [Mauremys mutica]|uniref:Uncharacterized protein n=1 Tax=Mauremys mutica TaxID=74926 RepID=A0A9D3XUL1_9SAUR|nr:hypothetical protein KIL84_019863 [Mauremys mutica]
MQVSARMILKRKIRNNKLLKENKNKSQMIPPRTCNAFPCREYTPSWFIIAFVCGHLKSGKNWCEAMGAGGGEKILPLILQYMLGGVYVKYLVYWNNKLLTI